MFIFMYVCLEKTTSVVLLNEFEYNLHSQAGYLSTNI